MRKHIIISLLFTGFILHSCTQKKIEQPEPVELIVSNELEPDELSSLSPYLTKDNLGNPVLSRILQKDSLNYVFSFSLSTDNGKTFEETIEIPGSENIHPHEENMPKVVFKPTGEIIAAWPESNPNENNPYSDVIFYSSSSDNGKTWANPKRLVEPEKSQDQRYFDFAVLPNGEIAISWLDQRDSADKDGSALYYAETTGGLTFENEKRIENTACECCRTNLFVDSKDNVHILYRGIVNDSIRDPVHIVSADNGKTFKNFNRVSVDDWVIFACPHTGPSMTEINGVLQFTWFTGGVNGGIYYTNSADNGKNFSARSKVSNGITVMHSQITEIENKAAIAWDENLSNHHQSASAIGIEIRNTEGKSLAKQYITPETGEAGFPVIKTTSDQSIIVAYTVIKDKKEFVKYRIIRLKDKSTV